MHGHMKSDSLIVLVKPPNKVGRPAAEAAPGIDGLRWEQYEATHDGVREPRAPTDNWS